ncbi:30S ribosomal protein S15 [Kocuria palustris]|nr:30S ribosomal protein S15 [Kocuria palustris]
MLKSFARLFTSGPSATAASSSGSATKINPKLAAKQFIAEDAPRNKARILRRKETRLKKQIVRDVNNFKKLSQRNERFSVDPVLGRDTGFMTRVRMELGNDELRLAYGYSREEFEKLVYGAEKVALGKLGLDSINEATRQVEERKKRALLTILNLKNTNTKDKRKMAISIARKEFERFDGDTGLSEVQAAVATIKIHFGMDHIKKFPKDKLHIQAVRELVQQRQRILKYLKKDDPERYYYTIAKLGLADDCITKEFNMGRQYFQDYKVWGDKQLIKLSKKQQLKADKLTELQKRVESYNQLAKVNHEILEGKRPAPYKFKNMKK